MSIRDYAITFACYNQLDYTKRCLESLIKSGVDPARIVAVDNLSSDGTQDYLLGQSLGQVILNRDNFGCGVAWNQGALALQAEWTIVMNNDVVVSANWLEGLLSGAERHRLLVASPAMIEGDLDYDLEEMAVRGSSLLGTHIRMQLPHAVCMAIHHSVWKTVGFFRATPRLLGYEDGIFFNALARDRVTSGTVGSSWIHHFGSITQKAMKQERQMDQAAALGDRLHPELGRKSWLNRKIKKLQARALVSSCRTRELSQSDMSLHAERRDGQYKWL